MTRPWICWEWSGCLINWISSVTSKTEGGRLKLEAEQDFGVQGSVHKRRSREYHENEQRVSCRSPLKQLTNWQLQYPTMASLRLILGPGVEGLVSAEVPWPPVSWEPSNRFDLRNKALRITNTLLQYFSSIYAYTSCIFLHWDYFYLRTWITINSFWTIWWWSTNSCISTRTWSMNFLDWPWRTPKIRCVSWSFTRQAGRLPRPTQHIRGRPLSDLASWCFQDLAWCINQRLDFTTISFISTCILSMTKLLWHRLTKMYLKRIQQMKSDNLLFLVTGCLQKTQRNA